MKDRVKLVEKFVGWRSQQKQSEKYSCWSLSEFLTTAGRPGRSTVNGHIFDRWGKSVDPGVDRSKQRALSSARSTRAVGRRAHMHGCARRSTRAVDRPLSDLKNQILQKPRNGFWVWIEFLVFLKTKSMIIFNTQTCYIILIEKSFLTKTCFSKNRFSKTWYF